LKIQNIFSKTNSNLNKKKKFEIWTKKFKNKFEIWTKKIKITNIFLKIMNLFSKKNSKSSKNFKNNFESEQKISK
jgi:hypothetical protein